METLKRVNDAAIHAELFIEHDRGSEGPFAGTLRELFEACEGYSASAVVYWGCWTESELALDVDEVATYFEVAS